MSANLTPAQRLAISRARLADALRDPFWLILVRRWQRGQEVKADTHADTPLKPSSAVSNRSGLP